MEGSRTFIVTKIIRVDVCVWRSIFLGTCQAIFNFCKSSENCYHHDCLIVAHYKGININRQEKHFKAVHFYTVI